MPLDVTEQVAFDNPDDEMLPLKKCVGGAAYGSWSVTLSVYSDDPTTMPCCGRRLWFCNGVRVYEQKDAE
jgi:hypothetical protein